MKILKSVCLFAISFLLVVSIVSADEKKLDKDNPIKVGYLYPFSLPNTNFPGGELAVKEINDAGGLLGRPLVLIPRDTKLNPEKALTETKDLIIREKVDWIVGACSSSVAHAVSEFCKERKKIYWFDQAQSPKLTSEWGHRYVFSATTNVGAGVKGVTEASVKTFGPLKKIYNLSPDYEGGHAAWNNFIVNYKKLVPDVEIVGSVFAKLGTQDFTPYLTAIMNSGAELLFTSFYQADALTMIKQSSNIGLNGKIAVASVWWAENMVPKFSADFYPKKTISTGIYPFWDINTQESNEFVKKIIEMDRPYPTFAACSYASIKLMAEAINTVGLDTEKIIDFLEGATMKSPVGPVKIRACDHQAMWPIYVGQFGKLAEWEFYGTKDHVVIGEEAYPTCEEVANLRK